MLQGLVGVVWSNVRRRFWRCWVVWRKAYLCEIRARPHKSIALTMNIAQMLM